MRSISYPPFIVFFDTLAVILFVLILNQSAETTFILPETDNSGYIFDHAKLIYKSNDRYYFEDGNLFQPEKGESILSIPCEEHLACQTLALKKSVHDVFVLIPDNIYSDGAKLALTAINNGCSGFKVFISRSGLIDKKKTFVENPCMKNAPGADSWISSEKNI